MTGLVAGRYYCFVVQAYSFSNLVSSPTNEVCATAPVTIRVSAGGNVQTAINLAKPGDVIELQAGATFVGNFVLPAKSSATTSYITIRSSAANSALPGPDVIMSPAYATQLPKLRSPNSKPALSTAPGAHHYRLQFLEFKANADFSGTIVSLGDGWSQTKIDAVPTDIVIDRVYIHGDPIRGQRRGITLNSASTEIINSHISDIKASGLSQAIAGWNGPGPYRIANNYLEAAGQTILIGGTAPSIPQLVPSDITITGNYIGKPLAWRTAGWAGRSLLELRNVRHAIVDGNVLENNWAGVDGGPAIRFVAAGSSTSTWSVVQDVEFTNNVVRNVASAISVARTNSIDVAQVSDISIRNNVAYNVSRAAYGGSGQFLSIAGAGAVTIDHNTIFNDGLSVVYAKTWPSPQFVFANNILTNRGAAIGSSVLPGNPTIAKFFPAGHFAGGVFVAANPSTYPAGNYYPLTLAEVGFVSLSKRNYRLSSSSIYRNGATDGTDPGGNVALLPLVIW